MNTRAIVVANILMLVLGSAPVLGYLGTREATLPAGVASAAGGVNAPLCERLSDAMAPTALYCEEGGFAAIFADIGCNADFLPGGPLFFGDGVPDDDQTAGNGDTTTATPSTTPCLDDLGSTEDGDGRDAWAGGSVSIKFAGGVGGEVAAMVGNDRDDDGAVTADDADGSSDLSDEDTPADSCNSDGVADAEDPARSGCYDDEFSDTVVGFVDADNDLPQIDFCFTRDRDHVGGDWDDIVVFLGSNLPGSDAPYVGSASVILDVESNSDHDTACGDNTPRSGHDDEAFTGGGATLVPPRALCDAPRIGLKPDCIQVDPIDPGSLEPASCAAKVTLHNGVGQAQAGCDKGLALCPVATSGNVITFTCSVADACEPRAVQTDAAVATGGAGAKAEGRIRCADVTRSHATAELPNRPADVQYGTKTSGNYECMLRFTVLPDVGANYDAAASCKDVPAKQQKYPKAHITIHRFPQGSPLQGLRAVSAAPGLDCVETSNAGNKVGGSWTLISVPGSVTCTPSAGANFCKSVRVEGYHGKVSDSITLTSACPDLSVSQTYSTGSIAGSKTLYGLSALPSWTCSVTESNGFNPTDDWWIGCDLNP